jgi:hypothetical protein
MQFVIARRLNAASPYTAVEVRTVNHAGVVGDACLGLGLSRTSPLTEAVSAMRPRFR